MAADYTPSMSTDGKKLAFVSKRSGSADIWIKDLPNGNREGAGYVFCGRVSTAPVTRRQFGELYNLKPLGIMHSLEIRLDSNERGSP